MAGLDAPCPYCEALNSIQAKRCRSCDRPLVEGATSGGLISRLFGRFARRG